MAEEKAPAVKQKMVIIEDDPTWVALLTGKLGKQYEIHSFASGEALMEKLAEIKADLYIIDYHLEGQMNGYDCLREIKKAFPNAYCVMFSAQEDVQVAVDVLDKGAYDYVVKREGAHEKLKIIFRNIARANALQGEVVELRLQFKRWQLALYGLVGGILLLSMVIYFNTCPQLRSLKWDPLNISASGECKQWVQSDPPCPCAEGQQTPAEPAK
jgi:PleD family two-component response regulator